MTNAHKKKIFEKLLIELKAIEPDLPRWNGSPPEALAEQAINRVNMIFRNKDVFDQRFLNRLTVYGQTYGIVLANPSDAAALTKLIKPTNDLILKTVEDLIVKLT